MWQERKDRKSPEGPTVVFTWKSLTFIPRVLCKIDNEVHDEVFLLFILAHSSLMQKLFNI